MVCLCEIAMNVGGGFTVAGDTQRVTLGPFQPGELFEFVTVLFGVPSVSGVVTVRYGFGTGGSSGIVRPVVDSGLSVDLSGVVSLSVQYEFPVWERFTDVYRFAVVEVSATIAAVAGSIVIGRRPK
jgi:hypothetical protein